MQRIGVFVCWCGSNIAGTVDVHKVAEALGHEPGVVFSTDYQYMCSQAGQDMIKAAVKEAAAQRFPNDIDQYIRCKSPCIEELYAMCGLKQPFPPRPD